jgi:PAS domain-containing protein
MEVALGEVLEGIVWTGGGRIESCNAAFEGLLGRSRIWILGGGSRSCCHSAVALRTTLVAELPSAVRRRELMIHHRPIVRPGHG